MHKWISWWTTITNWITASTKRRNKTKRIQPIRRQKKTAKWTAKPTRDG